MNHKLLLSRTVVTLGFLIASNASEAVTNTGGCATVAQCAQVAVQIANDSAEALKKQSAVIDALKQDLVAKQTQINQLATEVNILKEKSLQDHAQVRLHLNIGGSDACLYRDFSKGTAMLDNCSTASSQVWTLDAQ